MVWLSAKRLYKLAVVLVIASVGITVLLDNIQTVKEEEEGEDLDADCEPEEHVNMFGDDENRMPPIYLPAEEPTDLPVIVWWTPFVPDDRKILNCSHGMCLATKSRTELTNPNTNVSAFMFYGSGLSWKNLPLPRKPHHMWALLNEESPKNNWVYASEKGISLFNFTATYSRYSHYSLLLHYLHNLENLTQPQKVPTREKSIGDLGLVVYIQSDCNPPSDRDTYVQELMKYVKVDSYGDCLHNKDLPEHLRDPQTFISEEVHNIIARYKFALAFENAVCHDYITEKFWRPLYAATVPIVHGSPMIRDWAPTEHSIIVAEDFASPKELAEYLLELDQDDDKYDEYLEFKRTGVTNQLLLEHLNTREWDIDNKENSFDFTDGFQCYVCDELHKRRLLENPQPSIANKSHYVCAFPEPILKHPDKTLEERLLALEEGARVEMKYWRYISRCADQRAAVIESSISRGESQSELTERLKTSCANMTSVFEDILSSP